MFYDKNAWSVDISAYHLISNVVGRLKKHYEARAGLRRRSSHTIYYQIEVYRLRRFLHILSMTSLEWKAGNVYGRILLPEYNLLVFKIGILIIDCFRRTRSLMSPMEVGLLDCIRHLDTNGEISMSCNM